MKKQLLNLSVAFATTVLLAGNALAQKEAPLRVENCPKTTDAIVIDGAADEASWSPASAITHVFSGTASASDLSGFIKVCWDDNNLYFFADVTDDHNTSFTGTGADYTFDNVEVFVDADTTITNGTGAYIGDELQLRYCRGVDTTKGNEPRNDADYDNISVIETATGYAVEAAIPWMCFMPTGTLPEDIWTVLDKLALGFDVAFADNDQDAADKRDLQMAWDADDLTAGTTTEDNAWKDTKVFGVLMLTGGGSSVDFVSNSKFGVYPNPATDEISFKNLEGVTSIEIVNMAGQVVKNIDIAANTVVLNVSDLSSGIYFAKINTAEGSSSVKIAVK